MTRLFRGLVVLAILVGSAAAAEGRLNELLPIDLPTPVAADAVRAAPVRAAADEDVNQAVQAVIQRSNDQQAQAIAQKNPALMQDTVTPDHYQDLVRINQQLLDDGVTSIQLVRLDWGAVAINGSSASATTFETWTTTFADGSTTRSRDRNDYTLVLSDGGWRIQTNEHPPQTPAGNPSPSTQPVPGVPQDHGTSRNWSGYAATGGSYTAVSGTWTVPQFDGADASFGVDAAWVGIGGVRSNDLIQAGTQQTVSGSGRTQYQAWVEMLPAASRPVPLRVHAGDSVSVSITEQGTNEWLIEFVNNTTGQTYQETQQYRSTHSSAEWVQEAPSAGRAGVLPLSNFGTVDFSAGSTVKDGQTVSIAEAGGKPITMLGRDNKPLAIPSDLGSDGSSFSVARTDAPATTAPTQRGRGLRLPSAPFPLPSVIGGD